MPTRHIPLRALCAVLAAALLASCGASALNIQARAATTVHPVIDEAHDLIIERRGTELEAAIRDADTREEAEAARDLVVNRWDELIGAHAAVVLAYGLWLRSLVAGVDGQFDKADAMRLALQVLTQYGQMQAIAERFDLSLPTLSLGGLE